MEQTGLRVDSDANHSTRLLFIITYKNLNEPLLHILTYLFIHCTSYWKFHGKKFSSLLPERFLGFLIFDETIAVRRELQDDTVLFRQMRPK